MAGWENIVSDKELDKVKNDRKNEYIYIEKNIKVPWQI